MKAMILPAAHKPLRLIETSPPEPGPEQVLIKVLACGVCRTDLHVVDGELPDPKLPLIPGHEVVGCVVAVGGRVERFVGGERVGVPWLGFTCGNCRFCRSGFENLCDRARFTGYQLDGGYAEYLVADQRFCFSLPADISAVHLAPWMCAGLIGYRSLVMAGDGRNLGIYGFGAAAHPRWPVTRGEKSLPLRAMETVRDKSLPGVWARTGRVVPARCLPRRLMPLFCSRPSAIWFPWRCAPSSKEEQRFARAFI
jgi:D-arabinose 1-dehydrogenase-like Zn-dependent alcohol dehydrogenase